MQCSSCYKEFDANNGFCPFCGAVPNSSSSKYQYDSSEKSIFDKNEIQNIVNNKPSKFKLKHISNKVSSQRIKRDNISYKGKGKQDTLLDRDTESSQSEKLTNIKRKLNTSEIFTTKNYEDTIHEEKPSTMLILKNNCKVAYNIIITGIGNTFYENYQLKPYKKRKVNLQGGTYSIQSFLEGADVIWQREISNGESHYSSRSPIDRKHNADNRIITLDGGTYCLSCGTSSLLGKLISIFH